ncbi:hypothetical protein [Pontibaca salina]|uniref:Uncharacterized protein n=1 Tax=Pontibaca salina TaxID=2795731 RepID=A0A934M066_9RHOB|nr:hypothetical protein [Pontibaca salina]MBI6628346.1 hypothetical protein [Pontibaca salina]
MKNLASNSVDHETASRRWFAALLWRAFPSSSEHEISHKAARVLDVSPRQVQNWLRCNNDASLRYVTAVALIAGVEFGLSSFGGRP